MEIEKKKSNVNLKRYTVKKKKMNNITKRILDIIVSFLGIIILTPVSIIITFSIKINDPKGSVLFIQERVGKDQNLFKMYKFRTMYSDAEANLEELLQFNEIEGAMFKMKNDPRITKVGGFLRSTSMDELPQLLNVLLGNMSLVGPRPPLKREVEEYSTHDIQRLKIKPGITGLWQVSGRNSLPFKQMVELDILYINTQSLWNDILILYKTIGVVFKRDHAY